MRRQLLEEQRGRVVLIAASILLWLVILVLFDTYGYEQTWQLWQVPTEMPPFLDFRLIPGSAESFLRGFEPTVENPHDPRARIFNYPTFWRLFFYSGITQDDAIWISSLMIVLFFISVFVFPQHLTVSDALWLLFVIFSPASMLLYERGNVDLIVFSLCAAVVLAAGVSPYLTALLLMAGTVIKLFPFFGITVLWKQSKAKFLWLGAACLGVLLLYVVLTWESVGAAWNLTLRGKLISYGANVFFYRYEETLLQSLAHGFTPSQAEWLLQVGPIVLASSLILLAAALGLRNPRLPASTSERNLDAFRMGASIYVGTFLLGNNWDYRLAFLILVVPQLLEWTRSSYREYRVVGRVSMFAVLASCWHFVFWYSSFLNPFEGSQEIWFVIDELLNWMLVPGLAYLLFASAPGWAKDLLRALQTGKLPQDPAGQAL